MRNVESQTDAVKVSEIKKEGEADRHRVRDKEKEEERD